MDTYSLQQDSNITRKHSEEIFTLAWLKINHNTLNSILILFDMIKGLKCAALHVAIHGELLTISVSGYLLLDYWEKRVHAFDQ